MIKLSKYFFIASFVVSFLGWIWYQKSSEQTYAPSIDAKNFQSQITNPYFSLKTGTKRSYEAKTDQGLERIEIEVSGETKDVMGVATLVYHDIVTLNGQLIEDTLDYLAQDNEGNVWYFGEDVNNYENGQLKDHSGSWLAGLDGAQPGIWMLAQPTVGQKYRQEYYKGEAEDVGEVIKVDQAFTIRDKTYTDCIVVLDTSPIDPKLNEHKTYCAEIGGLVLEEDQRTGDKVEFMGSDSI